MLFRILDLFISRQAVISNTQYCNLYTQRWVVDVIHMCGFLLIMCGGWSFQSMNGNISYYYSLSNRLALVIRCECGYLFNAHLD